MKIAELKKYDVTNGIGVRLSIFVSGCEHYCDGCFNEVAWNFNYGVDYTPEIHDKIISALNSELIDGLSVLGGEPLHPKNIRTVLNLCSEVKKKYPQKTIWLWTGYTYDDLIIKYGKSIFKDIDILVDGRFDKSKRNIKLKYCGSTNQRVIDVQRTITGNKSVFLFEE